MTKLIQHYIGDRFIQSAKRFANINPVDGSIIGEICEAGTEEVDLAVKAARAALAGEWGRCSVAQRADWLQRLAAGIEQHFDAFVQAEVRDTGRTVHQARTLDVPRAIANFRFFADMVRHAHTECFETTTADGGRALNYTVRKPLGVVVAISPWNLPILLFSWKVAPALALGNAVIAKPSEETPSSAFLLAQVAHEIGFPAGAFNVLHGLGGNSTGQAMISHADIDAVTFTGASSTGAHIMKTVADDVRDVSFELGGKNAAIIFEDADFEAAIKGVLASTFTNSGQVCLCTERVLVHRSIFDRFVSALKAQTEALVLGLPEDPATDIGPMISQKHQAKVLSYFQLAREEGATVVTGGDVPSFGDARDQGFWVRPSIWTGLPDDARCLREEIFGPVCHIAAFDTEDEAIDRANDSDYGLATAIWTRDVSRAHRVSPRMRSGLVWVNTWYLRDLRTPFGGVRRSGIGREGGRYSLDFYSEITNICVKV
ncbi:2-hydroxymuconic semialdehyde dehydrogenase [Alcaligenaceae bacterium CGII-47]|nr:2-hydroxymuconic semialdehyde dehydrogenase [Alcaligenaceae bacterium CGII-47]